MPTPTRRNFLELSAAGALLLSLAAAGLAPRAARADEAEFKSKRSEKKGWTTAFAYVPLKHWA